MFRLFPTMIVLCLAVAMAPAVRSDETFATLKAEYDAAMKQRAEEFKAAYVAAEQKGDAAVKAPRFDKPSPAPAFSPRFLAIAEKNPEGPEAIDALKMALTNQRMAQMAWLETRARAIKILLTTIRQAPRSRACSMLADRFDDDDGRAFVAEVIARNPDRKVPGGGVHGAGRMPGDRVTDRRASVQDDPSSRDEAPQGTMPWRSRSPTAKRRAGDRRAQEDAPREIRRHRH